MKKFLTEHRAVALVVLLFVLALSIFVFLQIRTTRIRESRILAEKTGTVVDALGAIVTTCVADFNNIQYGEIRLNHNLVLKAWVKCELVDQNKKISYVNAPLFLEDSKMFYPCLANGVSSKKGQFFEMDQAAVHNFVSASVKAYGVSGITKLRLLTGAGSELILTEYNPFPDYYQKLDLNSKFDEYKTDSQKLPILRTTQIDNLLLPYKISVLK